MSSTSSPPPSRNLPQAPPHRHPHDSHMPPQHYTTLMLIVHSATPAHPFPASTRPLALVATVADANPTHKRISMPKIKSPSQIPALATCAPPSTISYISTSPQANDSMPSSTPPGELPQPASTTSTSTTAVSDTSLLASHSQSTKHSTLGNRPLLTSATSIHTSNSKPTSPT